MSKRVPEVIFRAKATNGRLIMESQDLHDYCVEHDGEDLFVHIEPEAQISQKMAMYAFYHRVVLHCAVIGYTASGESGYDTVKCDYLLRAMFAKDFIKDHKGQWVPVMMDKRNMTKPRLHKYIEDCIFFIESELQVIVPDSETYKLNKASGHNFKEIEK